MASVVLIVASTVGFGSSEGSQGMSDNEIDELGPVDYLVVEFPAGKSSFTGEMADELATLVDKGIIRVLDLLVLHKDDDGTVEGLEIDDLENVDELRGLEAHVAEILAADDVVYLAEAMENGSTAGVLVWENVWAAPFASAARRAGGQLVATGRIPIQAIIASIEAEEAAMSEGA
ncbi:MAG TPA: DUF6325 family protein [Actinomycetota bacterium]|nr:DUF6325 family protein [Actinomycetota bacterium]